MNKTIHYAWVALFLTFLALLAVQGVRLSFGAFIQPWEEEFSVDRATISLLSMGSFIIYGVSQPVVGRLIDRYGVRKILSVSILLVGLGILLTRFATSSWQLFALYAVIASLGVGGASNVAATVIITNWFQTKRGLAFGIMEAGVGVGQMLLVPASLFFIDWFGWKQAVLVQGLFLLVLVFPVVLLWLRNKPAEKRLQPLGAEEAAARRRADGTEESPEKGTAARTETVPAWRVLRMRQFWFLLLPFFVCGITTTGLMDTHLIPISHDHGFSTEVTSAAVSLLAGCNIVGILISGIVADRWSSKKLLCLLYGTRAISIVILIYSHEPLLLLAFSVLFGLVDFATVAPTQLLATQYFKRYSIGFILGWLFLSHQLGSALGAYLPGVLYSQTGSYQLSFMASILLLIGAFLLNLLLPEPEQVNQTAAVSAEASDGPAR
ncbi:MFS transporter [Brevibacillus fulvus]|uniref:Sugar phosphate permease n=1 Tax=Brevibacillus fulvus TaxID=1125967 RepID=A0A939BV54_9BACL|nr:MFS transporter [Brevibacillus fulvus]MBM7591124.1 sugar phosphate permease [Brevibacillus fulvus]